MDKGGNIGVVDRPDVLPLFAEALALPKPFKHQPQQVKCLNKGTDICMIVIPAPPGSQVAIYDTDEDGGRQMVRRPICAVILSDGPANGVQLAHAVTTEGPMVAVGSGIGWVNWGDTTP